jgi:hypothetical protein
LKLATRERRFGLGLDESLLLQHPQGLAQRGAADPQLCRQFHLVDHGAGREPSGQDELTDPGMSRRRRQPLTRKIQRGDDTRRFSHLACTSPSPAVPPGAAPGTRN